MKGLMSTDETSPQSLLDEANPNSQAAQLNQGNKREYEQHASATVQQSCKDCLCWPSLQSHI